MVTQKNKKKQVRALYTRCHTVCANGDSVLSTRPPTCKVQNSLALAELNKNGLLPPPPPPPPLLLPVLLLHALIGFLSLSLARSRALSLSRCLSLARAFPLTLSCIYCSDATGDLLKACKGDVPNWIVAAPAGSSGDEPLWTYASAHRALIQVFYDSCTSL